MKTERLFAALFSVLIVPVFLRGFLDGKGKKKPKHDACSAATSHTICNAANTCGSTASPCEVDIKRSGGDSASATPNIPSATANVPFCVKAGTTITLKSTSKDTGFVLDRGTSTPFDSGSAITGGTDRRVSLVAKKPGCYTYSVGACTAGTIYGMCGDDAAQFVVFAR